MGVECCICESESCLSFKLWLDCRWQHAFRSAGGMSSSRLQPAVIQSGVPIRWHCVLAIAAPGLAVTRGPCIVGSTTGFPRSHGMVFLTVIQGILSVSVHNLDECALLDSVSG